MPLPRPSLRWPLPPPWRWIVPAFLAGLLLFLLVWWQQRDDYDFYTAGEAPAAATGPANDLPAPVPADVAGTGPGVSGLQVDPNAPAAPPPAAAPAPAPEPAAAATPSPPPSPAAPASAGSTAGAADTPPTPLETPAPTYPAEAMRRGLGGQVRLRVTVAADGSVERLELAEGSGHRELDRAALETVRRWRFRPAQRGGQAVAAEVIVPLEFRPPP